MLGKCHADYILKTLKLVEAVLMHTSGMFEGQPFYTLSFDILENLLIELSCHHIFTCQILLCVLALVVNISVAKIQQNL